MLGSVGLFESPLSMAKHSVEVGQVIVPTAVTTGALFWVGRLSVVNVGSEIGRVAVETEDLCLWACGPHCGRPR